MARSYFSYSVVRSDPTNLTTGGDSILTTLKDVNWEVKKLDSSNNEVSTSIYTAITGNTNVAGAAGVTDWNGLIEFWADAGQYVIKITDPSSRIANKNIYWDSVSGQTGGIPGSTITSETITTAQIKDAEVKANDIDSSAVETAKIADEAITTSKIAPSGVTTDKIDNSAITGAKIASATIAQSNMVDGTYVPVGAIMQFAGASAPTNWLLCDGSERAVSTYPALDAVLGTTYGSRTNGSGGSGSSHFRLPDLRGRVVAGKDDMGGSAAGRLTATASGVTVLSAANTLGATGGSQVHVLSESQMPQHSHSGSTTNGQGTHSHSVTTGNDSPDHTHGPAGGISSFSGGSGTNTGYWANTNNYNNNGAGFSYATSGASARHTHSVTITDSGAHNHDVTTVDKGSSSAHTNTQPTIVLNFIIRAV